MRISLAVLALTASISAQTNYVWDLVTVPQAGQTTVYLAQPNGGDCGIPIELGDYNNDGNADYAITPLMGASGPGQNRTDSGEVIIIGGTGTIGGMINMQNPPAGQPILRIYGGSAFDYAGTELASGDVTGDGITDLIVGAMGTDPYGRDRAGTTYIIPGGANFNGGIVDLLNPPSWITVIHGDNATDRFGLWVATGDVDGDGIKDVLSGAPGGDGPNNSNSNKGEVVVIFGSASLPSTIDLRNPPGGVQISTVYGLGNNDAVGTTLWSGDLDGDGIEDLAAAAAMNRAGAANTGIAYSGGDGPGNSRRNCGDTYVVWGRANWPTSIDLNSPDPFTSANLTTIYGADGGDVLGEELKGGDFDGDGIVDLALGALTGDGENNCCNWAGEALVVYGGPWMRGQTLDARFFPANTCRIYGASASLIAADSISATDVNGDGFADFGVGSPYQDAVRPSGTATRAGQVDVIFGGPVRWPSQMRIGSLPQGISYRSVIGADAYDLTSYSMEAGDFDNDGFGDVFPNAMRGDGFNNGVTNAGEVNIVSGHMLARGLTILADKPRIGTTATLNALAEANAGFLAAFATSDAPGQILPTGEPLALTPDFLFTLSTTGSPLFFGMFGSTDATGRAQYGGMIPNDPSLVGLRIYTAFVTWTATPNLAFPTVSETNSFVIEP